MTSKAAVREALKEIAQRDGLSVSYYLDYQEVELDKCTIAKILEHEYPEDGIDELFLEYRWDLENEYTFAEIIDEVKSDLDDDDLDSDDIMEEIREIGFFVDIDYGPVLRGNSIETVLYLRDIDTPSLTEDFLTFSSTGRLIDMNDDARFLMKALGTSMTRFKRWYNQHPDKLDRSDKFHYSIWREISNSCYSYGSMCFLWYPTIEEYQAVNKAKRVKIGKRTTCGFVNFWPGSGSILEIELEKDLIFNREDVVIMPDREITYGVQDIYGLSSFCWENGEIDPA